MYVIHTVIKMFYCTVYVFLLDYCTVYVFLLENTYFVQ